MEVSMHPNTSTFISSLFERCKTGEGFVTLTAIHPEGMHPTPSRHIHIHDDKALERAVKRLCAANERGWGAYIGIAPRQKDLGRWSRGGRGDLVALPALYVDIDYPDELLLFRLLPFEFPPSCIVHSGHGYHLYWYLETPSRDFAQADKVLRALARYFKGDEKMTVAQSMRLPGTWNNKPERDNVLCSLVQHHPEWRYPLSTFARFVRENERKHSAYQRHDVAHETEFRAQSEARRAVIDAVTDAVIQHLDGDRKPNGFIAARCPYCHNRDRPGMHFSYQPASGWGYCFGKHGKVSLAEMCDLFDVPVETTR
jgi:RepB DNA-primase from phage plasmid